MTEPMRWLEPGSDVSGEVRALLAAGPVAPPPLPREAREEGARFIAALPTAATVIKPWWTKSSVLTAGLGVTSVVLVAAALTRAPRPQPHATIARAPVAVPVAVSVAAPVVAPVTVPVAVPVAAPERRPSAAAHHAADADARDERRLEAARVALDHAPATTLSIAEGLTQHGRHSAFAEEAEYLRVRALVRLQRDAEARRAGASFLRRHPSGIYSDAVRGQMERLP